MKTKTLHRLYSLLLFLFLIFGLFACEFIETKYSYSDPYLIKPKNNIESCLFINSVSNNFYSNNTNESEQNFLNGLGKVLLTVKDLLLIISLLIGIYFGVPVLRKTIFGSHIKDLIKKSHEANKDINYRCSELIDTYIPLTYENNPLQKQDIEVINIELKKLHIKALDASKEVTTLIVLLKNTFQYLYDEYNLNFNTITTNDFHILNYQILYMIVSISAKIINIPSSIKTEKEKYVNDKLDDFVINNEYEKFKFFEVGFDNNPISANYSSFYQKINNSQNYLIRRSGYKATNSPAPLLRLLYFNKLYFPLILKKEINLPIIQELFLCLIGFDIIEKEDKKDSVKLYYSNINTGVEFVKNLKEDDFINNYKVNYLKSINVNLKKINNFQMLRHESFSITVSFLTSIKNATTSG